MDADKQLRAYVAKYTSQAAAARAIGVTPQYLSQVLSGTRTCGPKVLKALGLARVVRKVA